MRRGRGYKYSWIHNICSRFWTLTPVNTGRLLLCCVYQSQICKDEKNNSLVVQNT